MQERFRYPLNAEKSRSVSLLRVSKKAVSTDDRLEFSKRLCAAMKHAEITQDQVAKEMGVANSTVHEWMTEGVTPRPYRWRQLARFVQARRGWLFLQDSEEEDMPRDLHSKLLRIFDALGRDRIDYLDSLATDELVKMVDDHELVRARQKRRELASEPT